MSSTLHSLATRYGGQLLIVAMQDPDFAEVLDNTRSMVKQQGHKDALKATALTLAALVRIGMDSEEGVH